MFFSEFDTNLVPILYGIHYQRFFKSSYRNFASLEFETMSLTRTQSQLCTSSDSTSKSSMTILKKCSISIPHIRKAEAF